MSSGILLVMALSLSGPIPNAASINSHRPDSVLLVRLEAPGKEGELDDSLGRLEAWINGDLKGRFGFDDDVELPFSPEKPQINPVIQTIGARGVLSSGKKIIDEILRICDSSDIREVRIETTSGRKEDAAGLSRLAGMTDLGSDWTVWYTDAHTGISVEIGGNLAEEEGVCLGHFERMWMNKSPVTNIKRIVLTDSVRGDLLTTVLDAVETVVLRDDRWDGPYRNCTDNQLLEKCKEKGLKQWGGKAELVRHLVAEDKRQKLIQDLGDRDIIQVAGVAEDYFEFYQYREGPNKAIEIPTNIFDARDGKWLEDIVALAIAEAWDCDRAFVGLNIGKHDREERMKMFEGITSPNAGKGLAVVWSNCKAAGILDDRFSELDFFDVDSFDLDEYKESLHEENEWEISAFVKWMVSEWDSLPKEMREEITYRHKTRDLDVFAQTNSKSLFLECKLKPGKDEGIMDGNFAQIRSLVSRVASRGVHYTILAHNLLELEVYRDQDYDYVVPWNILRHPDKMLEAVIDRDIPKKWWSRWKRGRSYKSSGSTEPTGRIYGPRGWDGWTPTSQDPPPPDDDVPRGNYYCPECMSSFIAWKQLAEHRRDSGHSIYKCEECSQTLLSNTVVIKHCELTGHKTISGTCYDETKLWVPWGVDTDAQERLKENGFFDKAIENRWNTQKFGSAFREETGKSWKNVFGAPSRKTKVFIYFNKISPGLILFIQGKDGKWYASDPGPGNEED